MSPRSEIDQRPDEFVRYNVANIPAHVRDRLKFLRETYRVDQGTLFGLATMLLEAHLEGMSRELYEVRVRYAQTIGRKNEVVALRELPELSALLPLSPPIATGWSADDIRRHFERKDADLTGPNED